MNLRLSRKILCCREWWSLSNPHHASDVCFDAREHMNCLLLRGKLDRALNSRQQSIAPGLRENFWPQYVCSYHVSIQIDERQLLEYEGLRNRRKPQTHFLWMTWVFIRFATWNKNYDIISLEKVFVTHIIWVIFFRLLFAIW